MSATRAIVETWEQRATWAAHNHGPSEGRGTMCGERVLLDGRRAGWCLGHLEEPTVHEVLALLDDAEQVTGDLVEATGDPEGHLARHLAALAAAYNAIDRLRR